MLSDEEKIRILVVDDHSGMREGISAVINGQNDMVVVAEASNGQEAIERFREFQPDVSLVDWNLPIVPGEEVISKLIAEFPNARFIVITALSDDDCIRRAFCVGAQAYLHKDTLRRELISAIREVHKGKKYLPVAIADRLKKHL